jgi:hypothetical protein
MVEWSIEVDSVVWSSWVRVLYMMGGENDLIVEWERERRGKMLLKENGWI